MSEVVKRPPIKESVGALRYCFNTPASETDPSFTNNFEDNIIKSEVVKSITKQEVGNPVKIYASSKVYKEKLKVTSITQTVAVVAFDATDIARMKGKKVSSTTGLITTNDTPVRPFFAFGKTVKLDEGENRYIWYPKCQLTEATDDISTSEESFSEQDDTLTITAYPFNDAGDIEVEINTSVSNPKNYTEAEFFAQVVMSDSDLPARQG